jgi:hypothetical protein
MLGLLEPTSQTDVFLAVRIPLDTTLTPKGGVRFWWCCSECSRRSGKLFQPPGASHFACRGCHGLTYTSTQQNHCHDRLHALLAARAPGTTSAHWHAQRMLPQRLAPSSFLVAGGTSLASRGEVTSPHGGGEQCGWRRRWES